MQKLRKRCCTMHSALASILAGVSKH